MAQTRRQEMASMIPAGFPHDEASIAQIQLAERAQDTGCAEVIEQMMAVDKDKLATMAPKCFNEKILGPNIREILLTAPDTPSFTIVGEAVNRLEMSLLAGLIDKHQKSVSKIGG